MCSRNLYSKAGYVVRKLPPDDRAKEEAWLSTVPSNFFRLGDLRSIYWRHPTKAVLLNGIEGSKMLLKFDETKVLNYVGIWEAEREWGQGIVDHPAGLLVKNSSIVGAVLAGAVLWCVILALGIYG
jgi:hypothetical protein